MICAEVIHGIQDSKKPFKTANIKASLEKGVYLCDTNYGHSLAICIKDGELEVHIFGFSGDIYGEILEVSNIKEIDKKMFLSIGLIINGILD